MSIIEFLERNWYSLTSAPLIFLACIIFGFFIGRWYFKRTIDILKGRIEAKDDQLDEYRQRLKLIHPDETGSKFTQMTHDELKKSALDLVNKIRTFNAEGQRKSLKVMLGQRTQLMKAESPEEQQRIWDMHTNQIISEGLETNVEYDRRFKVDAILLRDELLSRLPETAKNNQAFSLYEHPTNPIGMGMVAEDLERLAKSLELKNKKSSKK